MSQVLSDLEKLHAAEDFFSYLKIDYEPAVLRVCRLHILKRMGKYLDEIDFTGASEDLIFAGAQETLARAYEDFLKSRPIEQRVFKVLQEHDPARPSKEAAKPFVPLEALTIVR